MDKPVREKCHRTPAMCSFLIVFRNKWIIIIRKCLKSFTRCPKSQMQTKGTIFFSNSTSLNGKWNQLHMLAKVIDAQPHMVFFFTSIDEFSGISHIHELYMTHTHRCAHIII